MRSALWTLVMDEQKTRGRVMYSTACLRRQAELCLRWAQFCANQPLSRHRSQLAARYHEEALRAEFGVSQDQDAQNGVEDDARSRVLWH